MCLIECITMAVTEKDGIVHQDISAAPVTQEIYQVQPKRRCLDLEISRISYAGMELSRGFLRFRVPQMILLGSGGIWMDER